jgi:hypothetical protein
MGLLLGVNGLKIVNDYMYYTNSPNVDFCRARLIRISVVLWGPYGIISHDTRGDDFAIGPHGVDLIMWLLEPFLMGLMRLLRVRRTRGI